MDHKKLSRRPSHKRTDSADSLTVTETVERYVVKLKAEDVFTKSTPQPSISEHQESSFFDNDSHIQVPPRLKLLKNFAALDKQLQSLARGQRSSLAQLNVPIRRIFLTGATGYVGIEILRQMIEVWHVEVVALVRGATEAEARKRVVDKARMAGWWQDKYHDQFVVWLGDLAAPNMGLPTENWQMLCGEHGNENSMQGMIHAGAAVDRSSSAEALWSTNVVGTYSILEAAIKSPFLRSFVYVSGDAHDTYSKPTEVFAQLSDGYSQTKGISQVLVRSVAALPNMQKNLKSLQTGIIIGTPIEGIANTNDCFWRFMATVADLKTFDHEHSLNYVNISTVDTIAHKIIEQVMSMPRGVDSSSEIVIRSGLRQGTIWRCLSKRVAYRLQPVLHDEWRQILSTSFDQQHESHKLSAFRGMVETYDYALPYMPEDTFDLVYNQKLIDALNMNIGYLQQIGFLPAGNSTQTVGGGRMSKAKTLEILFGNTKI